MYHRGGVSQGRVEALGVFGLKHWQLRENQRVQMIRVAITVLSLFCAVSAPVTAQDFDPKIEVLPALYKVVNLSAGDILNVRAGPSIGSRDLGDLSAGQVVEATTYDTSGVWARIVWQEGNGWVHRRYLAAVETPMISNVELPSNLSCFGTEPFWQFTVENGSQVLFENPDFGDVSEPLVAADRSLNHVLRLGLASESWRALIQKKTCSDGATDRLYGLQIDLMGVGQGRPHLLSGCCQITPPADG